MFNFKHACDHHDGCYGGWKVDGKWVSRKTCDSRFLRDLSASCRWQHGSNLNKNAKSRECAVWAATYYSAVRNFGAPFYRGPLYLAL